MLIVTNFFEIADEIVHFREALDHLAIESGVLVLPLLFELEKRLLLGSLQRVHVNAFGRREAVPHFEEECQHVFARTEFQILGLLGNLLGTVRCLVGVVIVETRSGDHLELASPQIVEANGLRVPLVIADHGLDFVDALLGLLHLRVAVGVRHREYRQVYRMLAFLSQYRHHPQRVRYDLFLIIFGGRGGDRWADFVGQNLYFAHDGLHNLEDFHTTPAEIGLVFRSQKPRGLAHDEHFVVPAEVGLAGNFELPFEFD